MSPDTDFPVGAIHSRVGAYTPPVVANIAKSAMCQYIAGLLVPPELVQCSEVLVSTRPGTTVVAGTVPNEIIFRTVYQTETPAIGRQFCMVVVGTHEPADGKIDHTCWWSTAQLYVWDGGWVFDHEYEHMWSNVRTGVELALYEGSFPDPLDDKFSALRF